LDEWAHPPDNREVSILKMTTPFSREPTANGVIPAWTSGIVPDRIRAYLAILDFARIMVQIPESEWKDEQTIPPTLS